MSRPYFWTTLVATSLLLTDHFWVEIWGGYRWWMPVIAFVLTIFVEYWRDKQDRSLEDERQKFTINRFVRPDFDKIREQDPTARLNIMLTLPFLSKQRLFSLRKARAVHFFERLGFMDGDSDRDMVIYEGDGVAGTTLSHEQPAIGMRDSNRITVGAGESLTLYPNIDRNMSQRQRENTNKLRIIFSYPIRELRRQGVNVLDAGKVIGVINIDSQMSWDAWTKLIDPKDLMDRRLPNMANAVAFALA